MFAKSAEAIPYNGHKFLTGHCYYGGKITDLNDRKLLLTLLGHHYKGASFGIGELDSLGLHFTLPELPNKQQMLGYISSLPSHTPPQLLGLHPNANNCRKSIVETHALITSTMDSQPELRECFKQQQERLGLRSQLLVSCETILGKIPELINTKLMHECFPLSAPNALNIVLGNETRRYNSICSYVSGAMRELIRGLKGEVGMTGELNAMQECLAKQLVPEKWLKNGFRTNKKLPGFLLELQERLKFFKSWVEDGEPTTMWIGAFLCPQAVFEALRWNHGRHTKQAVDKIHVEIKATKFEVKSWKSCLKYSDFCRVSKKGGRWNCKKL